MNTEESSDIKYQAPHVLPAKLQKKAEIINSKGRKAQDLTKWAMYLLLSISAASVIFYIWILTL